MEQNILKKYIKAKKIKYTKGKIFSLKKNISKN